MALIADIFLISGAFGAAIYCLVLSRRLNRLSDLDGGVGKAIADLNSQVTDLSKTLLEARKAATESEGKLAKLTERAEEVAHLLAERVAQLDAETVSPAPPAEPPEPVVEAGTEQAASVSMEELDGVAAFVRGRAVREAAE